MHGIAGIFARPSFASSAGSRIRRKNSNAVSGRPRRCSPRCCPPRLTGAPIPATICLSYIAADPGLTPRRGCHHRRSSSRSPGTKPPQTCSAPASSGYSASDEEGSYLAEGIDPAEPGVITELLRLDSPSKRRGALPPLTRPSRASTFVAAKPSWSVVAACQPRSRRVRRSRSLPSRSTRTGAADLRSRSPLLPGYSVGPARNNHRASTHSATPADARRQANVARHAGHSRTVDRPYPPRCVRSFRTSTISSSRLFSRALWLTASTAERTVRTTLSGHEAKFLT